MDPKTRVFFFIDIALRWNERRNRDANIFPTMDLVLFTKQLLTVQLY